jgi:preprotein translocase subunit SecB
MKYALIGITAEELSYSMNRIQISPNTRIELKPQFARQIRAAQENPNMYFLNLEVKIESTEQEPKPFNLKCRLVGAFQVEDLETDEDRQILAVSMTEVVYPYLRSAVSTLTATAFINPVILPVVPASTMFPPDYPGVDAPLS